MKHSTLMDTDDLEPIIKPKEIDFDTLSIEELKEYIIALNAEIKRAETVSYTHLTLPTKA